MRAKRYLSLLLIGSFFFLQASVAMAEQGGASRAQELFEAALKADASGHCEESQSLLQDSVKVDPDFELARWHSGQVFFRGYWRSLETIESIVQHDPRWKEYYELLQAADDTADEHVKLARWCRRNNLQNEEELHWRRVLHFVPDHKQALDGLGKKPYRDGYYSKQEIAELRQRERQAELSFKKYQRKFKQLIREAHQGDDHTRSERLAEFGSVNDPAAVEALFDVITKYCKEAASDQESSAGQFEQRICNAVITALEGIPDHPATLRLLDIAVFAPQSNIRQQAAEALRYREPTSYIPLLMANLLAPLELNYSLSMLPYGGISLTQEVSEEGMYAEHRHVETSSFSTAKTRFVQRGGRDPATGRRRALDVWDVATTVNPFNDIHNASSKLGGTAQRIEQANAQRANRNARIVEVLEIATGEKLGTSPQAWWKAWLNFNEMYTPEELPVERTYSYESHRFHPIEVIPYRPMSCFLAGTPVWTQSGLVPIENIQRGDLVLSQDPISGRLDFRPVIDTTLRPPTEMLTLSINGESITTTLGHRFWLTGDGWKMAKFLRAGNPLYAVAGSQELVSVAEAEEAEAHNLVIDGYHTYFVGKSRLLVHDNTMPTPNIAELPGVVKKDARLLAAE